jgi:hypothetical protein
MVIFSYSFLYMTGCKLNVLCPVACLILPIPPPPVGHLPKGRTYSKLYLCSIDSNTAKNIQRSKFSPAGRWPLGQSGNVMITCLYLILFQCFYSMNLSADLCNFNRCSRIGTLRWSLILNRILISYK